MNAPAASRKMTPRDGTFQEPPRLFALASVAERDNHRRGGQAAIMTIGKSAGILMYKRAADGISVLLVHPGGPFWKKRDAGAWSIPKGEYADGEQAEAAARREFAEELGREIQGPLEPLGEIRQKAGKVVVAFAAESDFDTAGFTSNVFEIEWPPRSGRRQSFPEIDRAEWFALPMAREKIIPAQRPLLDRLETLRGEERAVRRS
jgi:predicted NUDIX family NTP pyrophosphohydrolase